MNRKMFNKIRNFNKFSFIKVVTITKPTIRKSHKVTGEKCPYENIEKLSKRVAMLGYNYKYSVNNRRIKEGKDPDFIPKELPWGNWLEGSKTIIEHKGKYYLRLTLGANNRPDIIYRSNGKEIPYENIKGFISDKSNYSQGLDEPIRIVNYNTDNIIELKFAGLHYWNILLVVKEFFVKLLHGGI